jgi:OOP family OmpA-OmpF porin
MLFGAVMLALIVWVALSYRTQSRQARYLEALDAEPGLTVISSTRAGGRLVVTGLRDPLARDPEGLVASADLRPTEVDGRWTAYQSLESPMVLARARQVLQPPAGVMLDLRDGVLTATGTMTAAWIEETRRLAPFVGGITSFDAAGAFNALLGDARARLEGIELYFTKGTARLADGQDDTVTRLAAVLADLDRIARATGQQLTIQVIGHTDADGAEASNVPLSVSRAETARALAGASSFRSLAFAVDGIGSRAPAVRGTTEAEYQRNRRVTWRLAQ